MVEAEAGSSKTDGTEKGEDIGRDGEMLGITEAGAAKGGGEIKDGEIEGGKWGGKRGKVLVESIREAGKAMKEGGVPRMEKR